jgi:drug/metabolite transporter (DMT)-like permease
MLLVSAAVMMFFYLCVLLTTRDRTMPFAKKKFFVYVLAAGILSCLYNRFNITLSSVMDAVIFFPAFNGGVVIVSGVLSSLIYKEKFSKRQLVGFGLALFAIFIIGVY